MPLTAKTCSELGWDELRAHLESRCLTTRGAQAARELEPSSDVAWIRGRLAEVSEARSLRDLGEPLSLGGVSDVEEALARGERGGVLDGLSLRSIALTLMVGAALRRHLVLRVECAPRLAAKAALMTALDGVSHPILHALDEAAELLDEASPALGPLRRKVAALHDELGRRCHTILDQPSIAPYLQDRFYTQREERYVIPVRVDARTRVPGIVHGASSSGQTVFVEPDEVVELNNRLRLAEMEVTEEERRILSELTQGVAQAADAIRVNLDVIAHLDLVDAAAQLAHDLAACEPQILESEVGQVGIDLRHARHPLMTLAGVSCVPNDVVLNCGQTLIISGPNAGGKTVALKTVGLLTLMARSGLPIPAQEGSSLTLFDVLLTEVGDGQSLEKNLSTFSAHILHLKDFLRAAGKRTLILLDELAVGTDPDQGAALAEAVLEEFAARQATVVVTTHYDRLKSLAARNTCFVNASVGFDLASLEPTYRLHLGLPGASGAIPVARRLGLPDSICDRATLFLGDRQQGLEELLADVVKIKQGLETEVDRARSERHLAEVERARASALARDAENKLKDARRGVHDTAVEALRQARHALDEVKTTLKQVKENAAMSKEGEKKRIVVTAKQEIDRAARVLEKQAPSQDWGVVHRAVAAEIVAGMEVIVPRLGARGVVSERLASGKVIVQLGPLKTTLGVDELLIPQAAAKSLAASQGAVKARPHFGHAAEDRARAAEENRPAALSRHSAVTIDLRGERVDAALALAEKAIDDALKSGCDAVYLVHGHGTGALRAALREHLTTFPRVVALRPGTSDDGGDGVTVVVLD